MDPEELDYETDWAPEGSWGHQIGVDYKLGKCIPVMCDLTGGDVIFMAGGKFYEFDQLGGSLYQIMSPTSLDEIIAAIKGKGFRGLKMKSLN